MAIEDSPGGVRGARAAGLLTFGVSTSFPASALRRAGATKVVRATHLLQPGDLLPKGEVGPES